MSISDVRYAFESLKRLIYGFAGKPSMILVLYRHTPNTSSKFIDLDVEIPFAEGPSLNSNLPCMWKTKQPRKHLRVPLPRDTRGGHPPAYRSEQTGSSGSCCQEMLRKSKKIWGLSFIAKNIGP